MKRKTVILTAKIEQELVGILLDIERAHNYLSDGKVVGIAHKTDRPNGSDYTIRNTACLESCGNRAEHITVMSKECGSHITGVSFALRKMMALLERINQKRIA